MTSIAGNEILNLTDLSQHFPIQSGILRRTTGYVHAVNHVNLSVNRNETLGIVGESGCGKSTLAKMIVDLLEPTTGKIVRNFSTRPQMIFQDPYDSLNPRHLIKTILEEPLLQLRISTQERLQKVAEFISDVGLPQDALHRYPHEFSGGQRQRIGIARALISQPDLVVCDEPVSALDVSIQSQILNLLMALQERYQLTLIFISHNLAVVRLLSDRIAVMYFGSIVELAERDTLFRSPKHPYTKALLSAIPNFDTSETKKERIVLKGELPSAEAIPKGCAFASRCQYVQEKCRDIMPVLCGSEGHSVACHFPLTE